MRQIYFKKAYEGASAGTRLFLQDGMWFYKTDTETEKWLTQEFVDEHPELFGLETTIWEAVYHATIKNNKKDQ